VAQWCQVLTDSLDEASGGVLMTGKQRATQGGQVFTGSGDVFQWADWMAFQQRYNLTNQTFKNGAIRATKVTLGLDQEFFYYGAAVTEGRRMILFNRTITHTEGKYRVDVITTTGGFTGGDLLTKSRLSTAEPSQGPTVSSEFYAGVTPVGDVTLLDEGLVEVGSIPGAARPQGATVVEGVTVGLTGSPMIRIQRIQGVEPYDLSIRLIVWEEDA